MDFFRAAQEVMQEAQKSANQRYQTAQAGKRLLDEGGPDVSMKLECKARCRRTVQADAKAAQALGAMARDYEDAIRQLRVSLGGSGLTPEERYDFQQLVGLYQERLDAYRAAAAAVVNLPPPAPFVSAEEDDAIRMLWAQNRLTTASQRASEAAENVAEQARAATTR